MLLCGCLDNTSDLIFFFLDSDIGSRPESMGCGRGMVPKSEAPEGAGIDSEALIQLSPV